MKLLLRATGFFWLNQLNIFTDFFQLPAPNNANLGKVQLSFSRFCFYLFASLIYIDLRFKYSHSFSFKLELRSRKSFLFLRHQLVLDKTLVYFKVIQVMSNYCFNATCKQHFDENVDERLKSFKNKYGFLDYHF